MADAKYRAVLQSETPPTEEQTRRLRAFIRKDIPIEWEETSEFAGGFQFRLEGRGENPKFTMNTHFSRVYKNQAWEKVLNDFLDEQEGGRDNG